MTVNDSTSGTNVEQRPRRTRPPAPTSISQQAQAYLSMPGMFDVVPQYPALDDIAGWEELVSSMDAPVRAFYESMIPSEDVLAREEFVLDGVTTYILRPTGVDETDAPIFLEVHGGGLTLGAGDMAWMAAVPHALGRGGETWCTDYRMPPHHPYPAALDDCLAAYRRALELRPASQIVVSGASAGGNLAAALVVRARDEGLPMPAALVLLTPELDLTESGDSFTTNNGLDLLTSLMQSNLLYAAGTPLDHPYVSPLHADVTGLPPTFLQAGTRDLFLSNAVRMHRKLDDAGIPTELHIFEAMPHGSFGGFAPEDDELRAEARRFEAECLARAAAATPGDAEPAAASGPRTDPVAGLSPEAVQALAGVEVVRAAEEQFPRPQDPRDLDAWRQWIAVCEDAVRPGFEALAAGADVEATRGTAGGVPTAVLTPVGLDEVETAPLFLEFHGGALVMCGGDIGWQMSALVAADRHGVTWVPDYRMPPDHPYPAPLDDCFAAYVAALEERPASRVVMSGTSAGGNLAAAVLLRARAEGVPMPAALILATPEVDLTESGDSFQTMRGIDAVPSLMSANLLYAGGHALDDPFLSPLFGDLAGFPPTFLWCGTRDFFLSNTVRLHRHLRAAGVRAELHIGDAMPHGGFGGVAPEDRAIARAARRFEHSALAALRS